MLDFFRKNRDTALGLMFILLSIGVYIASFSIREMVEISVGPRFVPRLVAVAMAILGAVLIVQNIIIRRKIAEKVGDELAVEAVTEDPDTTPVDQIDHRAVMETILLLILYVSLIWTFGFVLMTILYLFSQFWVLTPKDKRRWWLLILIAVLVPLGINYLFVNWFRLMLPSGMIW